MGWVLVLRHTGPCLVTRLRRILPAMFDAFPRLNAALEGHYTIEHELGEGGMDTVYLADDLRHERRTRSGY